MYKYDVQLALFYPKTMESFLSTIIWNHGYREYWRKL